MPRLRPSLSLFQSVSLVVSSLGLASPLAMAQNAEIVEEIIVSSQRSAYRGDFAVMETP